jgi:hypothetical protein
MTLSSARMPSSCSAMYGIVARIPVSATASASDGDDSRARTRSAVVTQPLRLATVQAAAG